jgi:hypothetical protein
VLLQYYVKENSTAERRDLPDIKGTKTKQRKKRVGKENDTAFNKKRERGTKLENKKGKIHK